MYHTFIGIMQEKVRVESVRNEAILIWSKTPIGNHRRKRPANRVDYLEQSAENFNCSL